VRLGWPLHAGNIQNGVLNINHDNCFAGHKDYCRTFSSDPEPLTTPQMGPYVRWPIV
jgi:hypothetical protein